MDNSRENPTSPPSGWPSISLPLTNQLQRLVKAIFFKGALHGHVSLATDPACGQGHAGSTGLTVLRESLISNIPQTSSRPALLLAIPQLLSRTQFSLCFVEICGDIFSSSTRRKFTQLYNSLIEQDSEAQGELTREIWTHTSS